MIISRKELVDKLKTNWGLTDGLPNPTNVAIPRGEYWQPKIVDVEKFLKLDWTNEVDQFNDRIDEIDSLLLEWEELE